MKTKVLAATARTAEVVNFSLIEFRSLAVTDFKSFHGSNDNVGDLFLHSSNCKQLLWPNMLVTCHCHKITVI